MAPSPQVPFIEKNTMNAKFIFQDNARENDIYEISKNGIVLKQIIIPTGKNGKVFFQGGVVVQ